VFQQPGKENMYICIYIFVFITFINAFIYRQTEVERREGDRQREERETEAERREERGRL
jgi:hypothetical protein